MFRSRPRISHGAARQLSTGGFAASSRRRGLVTDADVEQARRYCVRQLQHGDYESYLIRRFVPRSAQDAYDAIRTLNLELARLPETVSNPMIGKLRMQFWRDAVASAVAGNPPREPICILLHRALADLAARQGRGEGVSPAGASSVRFWLQRLVGTRERHMDNRPFGSLAALEDYAENTYATIMYATLACMPLRSVHVDHLASHVGKACGIVAVLRGIPVLAAPARAASRAQTLLRSSPAGGAAADGRTGQALLLPLDVMARAGVREEDVFRRGPDAPGLQDAVFEVATRAHDHLLTAREMLENLQAGGTPGHDFEHEGEEQHHYHDDASAEQTKADVRRGFGILLEAVPAADFLQRLEKANFDPFRVQSSWKLPWSLWRALQKEKL